MNEKLDIIRESIEKGLDVLELKDARKRLYRMKNEYLSTEERMKKLWLLASIKEMLEES